MAQGWRSRLFLLLVASFWVSATPQDTPREELTLIDSSLSSMNWTVRHWGVNSLRRVKHPRGTDLLIHALSDSILQVRQTAASVLAEKRDPRSVEPLVRALGDTEPIVVKHVIRALTNLGDSRAIVPLAKMTAHDDRNIRRTAMMALRSGRWQSTPPGETAVLALMRRDLNLAERQGTQAVEAVTAVLPSLDPYLRAKAITVLEYLGWQPRTPGESLIHHAAHGEWVEVAASGTSALSLLMEAVRMQTYMPDSTLQSLVQGLTMLGDAAEESVLVALGESPGEWASWAAIRVAGKMRMTAAVPALMRTAMDSRAPFRRDATVSLGEIGDPRAFAPILELAASRDQSLRSAALQTLGNIGGVDAQGALVGLLNDPSSETRRQAVDLLDSLGRNPINSNEEALYLVARKDWNGCAEMGSPAVDALVNALLTVGTKDASSILKALSRIGDPQAAPGVAACLITPGERYWRGTGIVPPTRKQIRQQCVEVIAALGGRQAVPALHTALSVPDADVRMSAVKALGALSDSSAVLALIAALDDSHPQVRAAAAGALGSIKDPKALSALTASMADSDAWVRDRAADAFSAIQLEPETEQERLTFHIAARNWLNVVSFGSMAVEPLLYLLADPDGDTRRKAAWAMGEIGDPRAGPALIALLSDEDSRVQQACIAALGGMEYTSAADSLLRLANGDWPRTYLDGGRLMVIHGEPGVVRPEIHVEACRVLVSFRDTRAAGPLSEIVRQPYPDHRRAAIRLMGALGDTTTVPILLEVFPTVEWRTQIEVAKALSVLRDRRAIELLCDLLSSPDLEMRGVARTGLDSLEWFPNNPTQELDYLIATSNWSMVGSLGMNVTQTLPERLTHSHEQRRMEAARALSLTRDPAAIASLRHALQDSHGRVRRAAAAALDSLGEVPETDDERVIYLRARGDFSGCVHRGPQGVALLLDKLDESGSEYERSGIISALGQSGDTSAVIPLIGLLEEPDWSTRSHAIRALGSLKDPRAIPPLLVIAGGAESGLSGEAHSALRTLGHGLGSSAERLEACIARDDWKGCVEEGTAAVDPMFELLQNRMSHQRERAAWVLGQIRDLRAAPKLVPLLSDRDDKVRNTVIEALAQLGWCPANDSEKAMLSVARRDVEACVSLGAAVIPVLLSPLAGHNIRNREPWEVACMAQLGASQLSAILDQVATTENPTGGSGGPRFWLAQWVQRACVYMGRDAVPVLSRSLRHDHPSVRLIAVSALGELQLVPVPTEIIDALHDTESEVRIQAAKALGNLREQRAVRPLVDLLRDRHWNVRAEAARALGKIENRQAAAQVAGLLDDHEGWVKVAAAEALGDLGDPRSVGPLCVAMRSGSEQLQIAAALSLSKIGSPEAVEPLLTLISSTNPRVRQAALDALTALGWKGEN